MRRINASQLTISFWVKGVALQSNRFLQKLPGTPTGCFQISGGDASIVDDRDNRCDQSSLFPTVHDLRDVLALRHGDINVACGSCRWYVVRTMRPGSKSISTARRKRRAVGGSYHSRWLGSEQSGGRSWAISRRRPQVLQRHLSTKSASTIAHSPQPKSPNSTAWRGQRSARHQSQLQNGTSLASGLVGHWTFDGPDITTSITDRSGQGNNGYFIGGATSSAKVSGKLGQALTFDGVDDRMVFTPFDINMGTVNSAALWIDFRDAGDGIALGGSSGDYFSTLTKPTFTTPRRPARAGLSRLLMEV